MSNRQVCFFVPREKEEEQVLIDLPLGWHVLEKRGDGVACVNPKKQLAVIVSIGKELDDKWWMHVSVSHKRRVPTHEEMSYVKIHFIGEDSYAIAVWPPKENYVNIHPNCLHLWCCLDEYPLPEFSHGMGTI